MSALLSLLVFWASLFQTISTQSVVMNGLIEKFANECCLSKPQPIIIGQNLINSTCLSHRLWNLKAYERWLNQKISSMIPDQGLEFLLREYVDKRSYWGGLITSTVTTESDHYLFTSTFTVSWPAPIFIQTPNHANASPSFSKKNSLAVISFGFILTIFVLNYS